MKKQIYCKSCFQKISRDPYRFLLEVEPFLCKECLAQVSGNIIISSVGEVKTIFLERYDGLMKRWLLDYKERGDVELAPCFLFPFLPLVKTLASFFTFVPCPSNEKKVEERGFDHLPLLLDSSHIPYVSLLQKQSEEEQKEQNITQRLSKKGISVKEGIPFSKNSICLFDDVVTSGSTLLQSYQALKEKTSKQIIALVLMDNRNLEKMRLRF